MELGFKLKNRATYARSCKLVLLVDLNVCFWIICFADFCCALNIVRFSCCWVKICVLGLCWWLWWFRSPLSAVKNGSLYDRSRLLWDVLSLVLREFVTALLQMSLRFVSKLQEWEQRAMIQAKLWRCECAWLELTIYEHGSVSKGVSAP